MEMKVQPETLNLNRRLESLVQNIDEKVSHFSDQENPLHAELQILTRYMLNVLADMQPWTVKSEHYSIARGYLQQAQRYVSSMRNLVEKFPQDKATITQLANEIHNTIDNVIDPIQIHITWNKQQLDNFRHKTAALKYQHAQLMQDEKARSALSTVLQNIASLNSSQSPKPRCYISYAWPTPQHHAHENWVQPFLCNLYQHLSEAGLEPVLDIKDQLSERLVTFAEKAKSCDTVLLIGTPSLLSKHKDPYWRIEKVMQSVIEQKQEEDAAIGLQRVIPIRLTGTPNQCFLPHQNTYQHISDWRDSSYLHHVMTLIGQIYYGDQDSLPLEYIDCWQPFWEEFPHFEVPLNDVEGMNKKPLDLYSGIGRLFSMMYANAWVSAMGKRPSASASWVACSSL